MCARIAAKNDFNSILTNHEITYDSVIKKVPPHPLSPIWKGKGAMSPVSGVPVVRKAGTYRLWLARTSMGMLIFMEKYRQKLNR